MERRKIPFDVETYSRRSQQESCFVCAIVAGSSDHVHHLVYEDDDNIAFLNRYPTLLGYCLVAPKRHVESWVLDFSEAEFVAFQRVVHRVARAVAAVVPTERMYSMSLGSQQGNSHVHWHVAPLPPGVRYREQQFHALMVENGVLEVTEEEQAALARRIRERVG
jgi:histidine triad (HIT) family protein/ATP adenylyltransferase